MDDDLDISLAILGLNDPDTAQQALEALAQTDPARAQQISQRLQFRQNALGLFGATRDSLTNAVGAVGEGLTRGVSAIGDALTPSEESRQAVSQLADIFTPDTSGNASLLQQVQNPLNIPFSVGAGITNAIQGADRLASDLLFPESQLQSALAQAQAESQALTPELNAALASVRPEAFFTPTQPSAPVNQLPNTVPPAGSLNIDPASGLTGFPPPILQQQSIQDLRNSVLGNPTAPMVGDILDQRNAIRGLTPEDIAGMDARIESELQQLEEYRNLPQETKTELILNQRAALLNRETQRVIEGQSIQAARNAALGRVDSENLNRLKDRISLQVVPQVNTNLAPAAALGQSPTIGAAPANFAQSLPLTQSVTPQVTVPDDSAIAQANIAQRNQSARLTQSAQERLQREQLRALELARQTFATTIARPILSERR